MAAFQVAYGLGYFGKRVRLAHDGSEVTGLDLLTQCFEVSLALVSASIPRLKFVLNTLPVSRGSRRRSWSRRVGAGRRSNSRSRRGCRLRGPARSCVRTGG